MSVGYEVSSRFDVNGQTRAFVPLTPEEERPFVAHALHVACAEFAPDMHPNVEYLETMQRRFDRSGGRDQLAAKAVAGITELLRRGIIQATSHKAIVASWAPTLPADAEKGIPPTYAIPELPRS